MEYVYNYHSKIGEIIITSDGEAITTLNFAGGKYAPKLSQTNESHEDLPIFKQACDWLNLYFNGKKPDTLPALHLKGTPFRMSVWNVLTKIPYGETTTYKKIAEQVACKMGVVKMSAQAVGGAVGHNPVGIMIPCHRVIGSNGCLTGYAGGLDNKVTLLKTESIDTSKMFMPKKEKSLIQLKTLQNSLDIDK